jgi:hypothetical protein
LAKVLMVKRKTIVKNSKRINSFFFVDLFCSDFR